MVNPFYRSQVLGNPKYGAINQINGMPYYESVHAGTTKTEFTRKQTRKFKNWRWVKKYLKKYSFQKFTPGAMVDNINKCLYIHPVVLRQMREQGL